MKHTVVRFAMLVGVMLLCVSCAELGDAMVLGGTDSLAKGKILPIKDNPKSLGKKRLEAYADAVPQLKQHVEARGYPDRIIETISFGGDRKVVMYYTKKGVAYLLIAEQFSMAKGKLVGPSPIGAKTKELFAAIDKLERMSGATTTEKKR